MILLLKPRDELLPLLPMLTWDSAPKQNKPYCIFHQLYLLHTRNAISLKCNIKNTLDGLVGAPKDQMFNNQ
jgi:hypothetical protein